jgi:hypothetical protein
MSLLVKLVWAIAIVGVYSYMLWLDIPPLVALGIIAISLLFTWGVVALMTYIHKGE